MELLDEYLAELSKIYASEKNRLLPISEVIDKLLDIRNSIPEFVIDGDEMKKYFGSRVSKG
jgi:hypothetical protein